MAGVQGLVFNQAKTRIAHLDRGVDFLGFSIRRYRGKLPTKPSKDAEQQIRRRLSAEMRALCGANADRGDPHAQPDHRRVGGVLPDRVSSRVFQALDHHVWRLTFKWARLTHPNKSRHWVVNRYFGVFNPAREDRWVFGRRITGHYLRKFAWTRIVRHQVVTGTASPHDPSLADYWAKRRRNAKPTVGRAVMSLLRNQHGRCLLCRGLLLHADHEPQSPHEWEQWLKATRKAIRQQAVATMPEGDAPHEHAVVRLIHAHCRRRIRNRGSGAAVLLARTP